MFHQFEKGTADRIRYQRVNERTTDEVEYSDIVKGAETGAGHYVMLDQEELDSVAPGRSRSMEIRTFVDLDDIDPIYFSKTYYLGPGREETGKVYALLRAAMGDSDKAAIASFVMRGKEYLAAVRADGDLLALETLFFADEVREPHQQISNLPERRRPDRPSPPGRHDPGSRPRRRRAPAGDLRSRGMPKQGTYRGARFRDHGRSWRFRWPARRSGIRGHCGPCEPHQDRG